ncbi:CheR family methyltransferase [Desulfitobacterium metallireducens]|uniref:Chemotaxis protein R n=1 Tax=Desulfitobacterium metallireducens DSM 15288 TaxID=871968 RepID=W0E7G8_9FIRM|nr:protein-glutamate O-methyltransferase CheR [Desulfitobacterium metallireducens]AHF06800.1 chemotaxis protein R [Desulfitobacterium metallireducens DSM 15288]
MRGGLKISKPSNNELETLEIELLLEGIYRYYGYDFRNYTAPYLQRRVKHRLQVENLPSISRLQELVLHDPRMMRKLFGDFTINVTEMFRDPDFFLSLRINVIPTLKKLTRIRIWQAGCSTGEESYSLAILLREEGLASKVKIYATDINEATLEEAKKGSFPIASMQKCTRNYIEAGGKNAFSKYYMVDGEHVIFDPTLAESIIFAQHDLVNDQSFNEFDLILCRNVMIYFNKQLQKQVHRLLLESLKTSGFLGLGNKEALILSAQIPCYEPVDLKAKIFRKII